MSWPGWDGSFPYAYLRDEAESGRRSNSDESVDGFDAVRNVVVLQKSGAVTTRVAQELA